MGRGLLLSGLLALARIGECARSGAALSNLERIEAQEEAEAEQTQGSGIWILLAAGGRRLGSGGGVYYEPPDRGCAALKNTTYPTICSGLGGDRWECEPRTLAVDGTQEQSKNPNSNNVFCPTYASCSCKKVGHSGDYTPEMCGELFDVDQSGWLWGTTPVDHQAFLQPIEREVCPVFKDACEEDCDSSWTPEKCKEQKCTLASCLGDFPRYSPEFMRPYSVKKDEGCWGRLKGNGKLGKMVLRTVAEYESLSKCCYRQDVEDGPKVFKWLSGNELVKSWRPSKWLSGRKVCDSKGGWHSANHLGLDGSTQEKCESLE